MVFASLILKIITEKFFEEKGYKVLQNNKERNYFASIENKSNIKIIRPKIHLTIFIYIPLFTYFFPRVF